jgi:hypothetical protein
MMNFNDRITYWHRIKKYKRKEVNNHLYLKKRDWFSWIITIIMFKTANYNNITIDKSLVRWIFLIC